MDCLSVVLVAVGLAMDAFAVSICKGLAIKGLSWRHAFIIGLWFGGFQALMPVIGYYLGATFSGFITAYDHWVVFAILGLIGANMIREALSDEEEAIDGDIGMRTMILLAIATSIDALAVGLSFSMIGVSVWGPAVVIGLVCAGLTALGVWLGALLGRSDLLGGKASCFGALVLIGLGVKILHEHGVF